MKTNREIKWERRLCTIMVPAGGRVKPCNDGTGQYWVDDLTFLCGNFYYHDAYYYGIRVNPEDVTCSSQTPRPSR